MNILLVTGPLVSLRDPQENTMASHVVQQANALSAAGHDVDVVAKDADEQNRFQVLEFIESPLSMKGGTVSEERGQEYYQTFQLGLLDVTDYDVIHYHSASPEVYEMAPLLNKPGVVIIHDEPSEILTPVYELFHKNTAAVLTAKDSSLQQAWSAALNTDIELAPITVDECIKLYESVREYTT